MDRLTSITKYGLAALASILLWLVLSSTGLAFNTMTVEVTVNSANALGGCWDAWCGRPDMFVIFYGTGTGAQSPACRSNTVIDRMNVGNPAPADWRCRFVVNRPGRLFIGLYDGDGPNQDNTQGQQMDIAPGAAKAVSVDLETIAAGNGASVTFQSQGDDARISYTVSAIINPGRLTQFTADKQQFQPSAGEQISLTAGATGAPYTLLRIHGYNSAGAEVWNIFGYEDTPGQTQKQFTWQGRDPNGNPLPPGNYSLKLEGFDSTTGQPAIGTLPGGTEGVGGSRQLTITILPPPVIPSLNVVSIVPSPKWAPEVGDLTISVVSSANATISGEVFSSTTCAGQKVADLAPLTVQALRPGQVTWNGSVAGGAVPVGTYGIKVSGTSNGTATSPSFICSQIEVITAPPALIYIRHIPFLAEPGQTVELTANSVDSTGAPRIVGRLDVFGVVQSVPGTEPPTPTTPLRTCTMAVSCTANLTLPSGGSFFSWMATAADRSGSAITTLGWRGQRVIGSAAFAQSTGFAMPVDAALNGSAMSAVRDEARSFELLFSVSTDFDWASATDRRAVSDALDRFMTRFWGIAGIGAPALTTFMSRPDLVRIYVTPDRNVVSWNPAANLCDWSVFAPAWADATAILHKTECRDNADPYIRSFSAKLLARDVILHELHHALFGLADEYPAGDGGYEENQPFANIYNTLAGCTAVTGREPAGCTPITEIDVVTRIPTGRTFFRLDASLPDIMVNNGTQRFADVGRARWKEGQCDAGGC